MGELAVMDPRLGGCNSPASRNSDDGESRGVWDCVPFTRCFLIHELAHVISDLGGSNRVWPLVRQIFPLRRLFFITFETRLVVLGMAYKFCVFVVFYCNYGLPYL